MPLEIIKTLLKTSRGRTKKKSLEKRNTNDCHYNSIEC